MKKRVVIFLKKFKYYGFFRDCFFIFLSNLLWLRNKIMGLFVPTAFILLYHRVADVGEDPHQLSVSLENFRLQMNFLKNNFRVIKLSELVGQIKDGKVIENSVAITFDDGYADNFYEALPVLKEYNFPATIFVTAGKIDSPEPFYWDQCTNPSDQGRPLTKGELYELASNNLIEIGSHTVNHPILSSVNFEEQYNEIKNSKRILEDLLDKEIEGFAYPVGSKNAFCKETVEFVKKVGYNYACTTAGLRVNSGSKLHTLSRQLVRNWGVKKFALEVFGKR